MKEEIKNMLKELNEITSILDEMEFNETIDSILKNCLYFILILDSTKDDKELSSIVMKDAKIFLNRLKEELIKEEYPDIENLECMKNFK